MNGEKERGRDYKELAHGVKETGKIRALLSVSWRPRKTKGVDPGPSSKA